jgi:hypothetical protein
MNMQQRIVTETELEKALDFLRDNARALGDAKARVVRAGHMLKHIEALHFKLSNATSNDKRQADARTSEAYLEAITEDAEAAGAYETMRALREAAALKIESWRSEQATYRAMKI